MPSVPVFIFFVLLLTTHIPNGMAQTSSPKPELKARQGIPIGTTATSPDGSLTITLAARLQHYNPHPRDPRDHYDPEIQSPKSAKFLPGGKKAYVNSLEGSVTAVYDPVSLRRIGAIAHRFNAGNSALISSQNAFDYSFINPPEGNVNYFAGKPVEMEFTHGGRYLWVSYYRRSYDKYSLDPSAVAVIDTSSDAIVKVLPAGPIPKYLAASPDGKWLAMIHWGDNTVGFVDVSSAPERFALSHLVTVQTRLNLRKLKRSKNLDRDKTCGYCLRGAVFTPDSKYLLVGRLSGGGIAVINVPQKRYVGTVLGMQPTPRHLVMGSDGKTLFVGSNVGGYVSKFNLNELLEAASSTMSHHISPEAENHVGYGVRTIALSPDERWVYAAVNGESELAVLRADDLSSAVKIPVDSFPVGLAASPDGKQVWVTSQGRNLKGGNSVSIYSILASTGSSPHKP